MKEQEEQEETKSGFCRLLARTSFMVVTPDAPVGPSLSTSCGQPNSGRHLLAVVWIYKQTGSGLGSESTLQCVGLSKTDGKPSLARQRQWR